MREKSIVIGADFSKVPAGRFPSDGPNNGQKFRKEYLIPALKAFDEVVVDLSGTVGYGSSFLEEVFGGLYREQDVSDEMIKRLKVIATDQYKKFYIDMVKEYMKEAEEKRNASR